MNNFLLEENLTHYSFFDFPKRNHKEPRKQGGSCPILYALKNLDGLKLSNSQRYVFFNHLKKLIKKELKQKIDYVICLPSSDNLTFEFSILLAKHFNANILQPFEKISNDIKMKNIKIEERKNYQPLKLKNFISLIELKNKNILIVDDVLASGITIKNAFQLLKEKTNKIQSISIFRTEC